MDNSLLKNIDNPKITVVTVCFNAAKTLEKTIQSVINQTYNNIEYIIIDGASTDGTLDIIKKYEDRISYWKSEPDKGIYDAMNKGIKLATGDYIAFMNAGDKYYDNNVVADIFYNCSFGNNCVVYGKWYNKRKKTVRLKQPRPFWEHTGFRNMGFSHQATFVSTSYAKKRMFDLNYKLVADYNMIWCLYYSDKLNFINSNSSICIMDEEGFTEKHFKEQIKEICHICGISGGRMYCVILYKMTFQFIKRMLRYFKTN